MAGAERGARDEDRDEQRDDRDVRRDHEVLDRDEDRRVALRIGEQRGEDGGRREHQKQQEERTPGDRLHGRQSRKGLNGLRRARDRGNELIEVERLADDIGRPDALRVTLEIVRG